jgi:surfactin synthase thioesterase subunit
MRLFGFPYAGGGPSLFRQWRPHLPEWIDLVPIHLPGRESRFSETPFTNLDLLTESVVQAMASELDVPYALFGHSMGALIAFEVALRLDASPGEKPSLLLVSGRAAPHSRPREKTVHQLPDDDFIRHLQEINGTEPEIFENRSLLNILLPVLRADFTVCETYVSRPGRQLTCPIISFGGLDDREVAEADVAAWSNLSAADFACTCCPAVIFSSIQIERGWFRSWLGSARRCPRSASHAGCEGLMLRNQHHSANSHAGLKR